MTVKIKKRYAHELADDVVCDILRLLGLPEYFQRQTVVGNGRDVIIETEGEVVFVIVSRADASDGRNAFLAQYIPTVLSECITYNTQKRKLLFIYLLDTSDAAKVPFIADTYRIAKTLGIEILNERQLNMPEIKPYSSFREWRRARVERQNYNPANNSSYAIEDEYGYTVFGKLYGANGKEAALMACLLSRIAKRENKQLFFVQVKEHGTESVSATDRRLLEYYGVGLDGGEIVLDDRQHADRSTCRKQDEFKFNLLEKFGSKKCYLCGCAIESAIIASHIHRITDIDHSPLTEQEKRRRAVDADNGFWLCANHDKFFENGVITFGLSGGLLLDGSLTDVQREYVDSITQNRQILPHHLTEGVRFYLRLHNERVGFGND